MAVRIPVRGKNVTLKVWKVDQYVRVACLVDVEIWISEEYYDTSTPDSGRYVTRKPANKADWGVDIESVTVLEDDNEELYFTWEFFLELARSNGVNIELSLTDVNGGTKVYRGLCFLPMTRIRGSVTDYSRSRVTLIGGSAIEFSGSVTPSTFHTMRIEWTATAGQTEFQDNDLIGKTVADILYVHREGEDKYKVVTGAAANERQVELDATNGKLIFFNKSDAGQFVYCIIRI